MRSLLAGVVALVIVLGQCLPAHAAVGKSCVRGEQSRVHAAGDSVGDPPSFSPAFYRRPLLLDVGLDGLDGSELPISIDAICSVPKRLKRQAAQLVGGDGVALLRARTSVWRGHAEVSGRAAAAAIDGADEAILRARLLRPPKWRADEDGNPVPTFRTGRVWITE